MRSISQMQGVRKSKLRVVQFVVFSVVAALSFFLISPLWQVKYSQNSVPTGYFAVIAVLQDRASNATKYELVNWDQLDSYRRDNPKASFHLPIQEGAFSQDPGVVSDTSHFARGAKFKVERASADLQIVRLDWDINDDYSSVSTYSTDGTSITPMSSYLRTPGPIIYSFLLALVAAVVAGIVFRATAR